MVETNLIPGGGPAPQTDTGYTGALSTQKSVFQTSATPFVPDGRQWPAFEAVGKSFWEHGWIQGDPTTGRSGGKVLLYGSIGRG
jgi:hypothetical protein